MGHISIPHHVDAPVERVFDFACDTRRATEWAGWITDVDAGDGFTSVGQRFTSKGHLLGRTMDMEGEVVEFERPTLITLKGTTSLGSRWIWRTRFTPTEKGTDIDLDYEYDMPGKLTQVFDRLVVERTMDRDFRSSCETFVDILQAEVLQPA